MKSVHHAGYLIIAPDNCNIDISVINKVINLGGTEAEIKAAIFVTTGYAAYCRKEQSYDNT